MGLDVQGRQGLDGNSLGGVEVPQRDQMVSQGSRFVARPGMERGDELRLLDQAGLQGEQAEEEMMVGSHQAPPWILVRAGDSRRRGSPDRRWDQ